MPVGNYVTGPAVPPPPEEMGWKDTVKSMPGEKGQDRIFQCARKLGIHRLVNVSYTPSLMELSISAAIFSFGILAYELATPPLVAFTQGETPAGPSIAEIERVVRQVINEILEIKPDSSQR